MDEFYETGRFPSNPSSKSTKAGLFEGAGAGAGVGAGREEGAGGVEIPVGWRSGSWKEAGEAVCWLVPVWIGWALVWGVRKGCWEGGAA